MFGKKWLAQNISDFCNKLGIDPLLAFLLFSLLLSLYCVKDIKRWREISNYSKFVDIMIWYSLLIIVILVLLHNF